jgi:hypothetical protein
MDDLPREIAALVEQATCAGESPERTFTSIERLVLKAAGRDTGADRGSLAEDASLPTAFVPRLTEAWFCCAEPTTDQFGLTLQTERAV